MPQLIISKQHLTSQNFKVKALLAIISKQHFLFIYLPVQQNFAGHSDDFCYPKRALHVKMLHLEGSKASCGLLAVHAAGCAPGAACERHLWSAALNPAV